MRLSGTGGGDQLSPFTGRIALHTPEAELHSSGLSTDALTGLAQRLAENSKAGL